LPGAVDVRIIVDISGSMECKTIRKTCAPWPVRLPGPIVADAHGAVVWTFGQYVNNAGAPPRSQ